mmetsp:Transcript_47651/g.101970  ORF Transcript_47651/g.101970 Transcript_47651/m.101970 type:complete len:208 (-) Transcript_47651:3749-4372(-)
MTFRRMYGVSALPPPRRVAAEVPPGPAGSKPAGADSVRDMGPFCSLGPGDATFAFNDITLASNSLQLRWKERFSLLRVFISAMRAAFSEVRRRKSCPHSLFVWLAEATAIWFLRKRRSRWISISSTMAVASFWSPPPAALTSRSRSSAEGAHWLSFWCFSNTACNFFGMRSNSAVVSACNTCSTSPRRRLASFLSCVSLALSSTFSF